MPEHHGEREVAALVRMQPQGTTNESHLRAQGIQDERNRLAGKAGQTVSVGKEFKVTMTVVIRFFKNQFLKVL